MGKMIVKGLAAIGGAALGYFLGVSIVKKIEAKRGPMNGIMKWVIKLGGAVLGALLAYFIASLLTTMLFGEKPKDRDTVVGKTNSELSTDRKAIFRAFPSLPRFARQELTSNAAQGASREDLIADSKIMGDAKKGVLRRALNGKGGPRANAIRVALGSN